MTTTVPVTTWILEGEDADGKPVTIVGGALTAEQQTRAHFLKAFTEYAPQSAVEQYPDTNMPYLTVGRLRGLLASLPDTMWVAVKSGFVTDVYVEPGANEPFIALSAKEGT